MGLPEIAILTIRGPELSPYGDAPATRGACRPRIKNGKGLVAATTTT
jgi:hypothetical protein